jgi:ABC-type glycerol-3-phosphate transport system permease component
VISAGITPRHRSRFGTSRARARLARVRQVLGSHGVMVLACVIVLLPFIWVLLSSFKTIPDFYHWPPSFWPKQFTLAHYAYAFGHFPLLWGYYANSWVITPTTVAAVVVISTMAGYAFARLPFRVGKGIFVVMVATLFFPVQIISVFVMYQLTSAMGLIDTRFGLILAYTSLLLPVYIFIMRTVFAALPGEIEEAAKVDGASNWQVFRKVMLPLAKPGIAVVVILSFVNVWGEYLWAETLTVSKAVPIGVGITQIQTNMGGTDLPVMTAAYVIAIVPPVLLFVALQRWFMGGLQGLSVGKDA